MRQFEQSIVVNRRIAERLAEARAERLAADAARRPATGARQASRLPRIGWHRLAGLLAA